MAASDIAALCLTVLFVTLMLAGPSRAEQSIEQIGDAVVITGTQNVILRSEATGEEVSVLQLLEAIHNLTATNVQLTKDIRAVEDRLDGSDAGSLLSVAARLAAVDTRLSGDLDAVNASCVQRFDTVQDTIGTVDGRVTTVDGRVTTVDGRVTTVDGRVTTVDGRVTTLDTRLTNDLDAVNASCVQRFDTVQDTIGTVDGRVTTVDGRVTTVDGRVTTVDGRVTTVDGRVTSLDTRLTNDLDAVNASCMQRFNTVQQAINDVDGRVTTVDGRVTTVDGRVTTVDGRVTTVDGRVTTEINTVTSQQTDVVGKLNQNVTSVSSEVDALTTRVSSLEAGSGSLDVVQDILECAESQLFYSEASDKCITQPPPKSCAELKAHNPSAASGTYLLKTAEGDSFEAHCDMEADDGGWTLVAKVTDNFGWICPDQNGANCLSSSVDPSHANLFHPVHERNAVDLSFQGIALAETGVHLPLPTIRRLFTEGVTHEVRIVFADNGWTPKNDGVFRFYGAPTSMFKDGMHSELRKGNDYDLDILTAANTFTGNIICWGLNVDRAYRAYDQGLHLGVATSSSSSPCHMQNSPSEVQLKSHYTSGGPDGHDSFYPGQHAFLENTGYQVGSNRIAIYVRSKPRVHKQGSLESPGLSCKALRDQGIVQSGTYWLKVNDRTFPAYCDMTTDGGGFTLVAKVTEDFGWACPDVHGAPCKAEGSGMSADRANLFEDYHTRDSLSLLIEGAEDTGIHLPVADIRTLFLAGSKELRFLFAKNPNWTPKNDVVAQFSSAPAALFTHSSQGAYARNTHYTVNVLTNTEGSTTLNLLCWGLDHTTSYRSYEGGLHFGISSGGSCHLDNNNGEVMMKSHIAGGAQGTGVDSQNGWYVGDHGFLHHNRLQVESDRIAIFVR